MNSAKKNVVTARGVQQPVRRPRPNPPRFKPEAAPPKAVPVQLSKRPSAAPVSHATPNVVLRQVASGAAKGKTPVAPPVYRPQPPPKVLQRKASPVESPRAGQASRQPLAPPVYRPVTKRTVQPKALPQTLKSPSQSPGPRPEQKTRAHHKNVPATPASARSVVQRQHVEGIYRVTCYANLRAEGTYEEIAQVTMGREVRVLNKEGRISNFKAGWVTNEHSWVEVETRNLHRWQSGEGTIRGWINDDNLRAAPIRQNKVRKQESDVAVAAVAVEDNEEKFRKQVERLCAHFNKGAPAGLSVTAWLRQLGGSLAQASLGSLAYYICEDVTKTNSLFIIDEGRANLQDKNWAQLIVENFRYRGEYPETVRTFLKEEPCPVPQKLKATSIMEMFQ